MIPRSDILKPLLHKRSGNITGRSSGFTLVESLVTIAIIATISAVATVSMKSAVASARATNELNAARQLTGVYLSAAADNNGVLLAGIDPDTRVTDSRGVTWPSFISKRYPARLAEALDYNFKGSVCVNQAEAWADDFYSASVHPSFGINATFVGGSFREPEPDPIRDAARFGDFCVRRLSQLDDPARQLVFASARSYSGNGSPIAGNFYIRSPYLFGRRWKSTFDPTKASLDWGNVDPRHNNKAVCAFLDGSAKLLGTSELQDMRHWAKGARDANDPKWTLQ